MLKAIDDADNEGPELFTAMPSDDIPHNKLTEQLARGLQSYVQRMQKKESFYAELTLITCPNWNPAPREYSSLTYCNRRAYLIGGLNYDTNKEVGQLRMNDFSTEWRNVPFASNDKMVGRCRHTSCAYQDKIYTFGGSFMFNKKRQMRECTSQVWVYDTIEESFNLLKTKGVTVNPRKDHCAAIYSNSMIVYGG